MADEQDRPAGPRQGPSTGSGRSGSGGDASRGSEQGLLRRAAGRAAGRDFYLASALLPWAEAEGLDDGALAERLGCRPADLARVLLCRRPRREAPAFGEDVAAIAAAFGLSAAALAEAVRQADGLRALRAAEAPPEYGWLAAARDREPEPGPEGSR